MSKSPKNNKKPALAASSPDLAIRFTEWIGSSLSIFTHTIFFVLCLAIGIVFAEFDRMLLFLTTVVSLEAIYLAILIQMTVNRNTKNLAEVGKDIDEIQEDIDEIQEDVDDIEEGDTVEEKRDKEIKATVESIQKSLEHLMKEINSIKK